MEMLKILMGRRNQNGAGLPKSFILEMRFLLAGILLVTLLLTGWGWMQKKERESYVSQPIEKFKTAAGIEKSRN
jgi:hypothetical protein